TADDWLILAIGNDGQWQRFCTAVERPDWASDARFTTNHERVEQRAVLVPMIEQAMRTRTYVDWDARLEAGEIPHAPVMGYPQLFAEAQIAARGMKVTVRDPAGHTVDLAGTPFHIEGATLPPGVMPPRLGEHTNQVLHNLLGL